MRAAPRADHRVDLVDDDRTHRRQHLTASRGGQEEIERFWCRDQDVRRLPQHRRSLGGGRVTSSDGSGDRRFAEASLGRQATDALPRLLEVLVDVRAQSLERRNVEDADLVREGSRQALGKQVVQGRQKRRERLARPGGRCDEGVAARRVQTSSRASGQTSAGPISERNHCWTMGWKPDVRGMKVNCNVCPRFRDNVRVRPGLVFHPGLRRSGGACSGLRRRLGGDFRRRPRPAHAPGCRRVVDPAHSVRRR